MWSAAVDAIAGAYRYISSRLATCAARPTRHPRNMSTAAHQNGDLAPYDHAAEGRFTVAPNPGWTFGQPVTATPKGKAWMEGAKEGFKVFETDKEDPGFMYKLMISGVVPRPVAFVSSVSADGVENLAPFSWFNMVTGDPPLVAVGVLHHPDESRKLKDTAANILATKGFVVNLISEPFVHNANACSFDAPPDVSEWDLSGLTRAPSLHVPAPRVLESAFALECTLYSTQDITNPQTNTVTTTLMLGLVKAVHLRRDMLTSRGLADAAKLQMVGKMGDITYARQTQLYRIPRPDWSVETVREAALHPQLNVKTEHGAGEATKA
ncbi:uncharacterized protein C8Q71DRAFT_773141 [Rhodofomes roseus]|uniref:Flavin reductase like domain-containing protein n=1 Tax=Rhodofomes roseus TaxID=34475 RepID=A0ABQ8K8W0_9APHY|nr:uncharacterized protein C8Q71DRAFT_773141 [Rhodofomes roseus]KAH9833395.1 hypothetical protein C8Q71DRAFT_773141 [Rhodofomes roseus]